MEGDKGIMKKMFGNITFPVGHSAIITLDEFGHAAYFEYGRYNGKDKNVIGNTRRINGEPILEMLGILIFYQNKLLLKMTQLTYREYARSFLIVKVDK